MGDEEISVEGVQVRFVRSDDGTWGVFTVAPREQASTDRGIRAGSLELLDNGSGFLARRPDGSALMRPSPWGGEVSARFSSRELAARALLLSSKIDG